MDNSFSKEERVNWEMVGREFEDALVMSKNVAIYTTDQTMMARTGDTIWRPEPYIATSYDGVDMTGNFNPQTQLSVPAQIGYDKSSPFTMTAKELRDPLQWKRLAKAAAQRLASDINYAVLQAATAQGTIVVTSSAAAVGFADLANIEAAMNRVGIPYDERQAAYSTVDYNGLAKDLANRQNMVEKTAKAYERGYVGMVCSFDTWKQDYALLCNAAAGGAGLTVNTTFAGNNWYVPAATVTTSSGRGNVDNRTQQITVSSTTSVLPGDCFTIAGVYEVHHINKLNTGSLKTFRVTSVDSATLLTISPPIISAIGTSGPNNGPTIAELQYQNCSVYLGGTNSRASGGGTLQATTTAAIVFLNTAAKYINPFWHADAIELLPGRSEVPPDAGVGILETTTENGILLQLIKWFDIKTKITLCRMDVTFGVCVKQPEMCGIQLFSQT